MAPLKVSLAQGRRLWCEVLLLCALLMLHQLGEGVTWLGLALVPTAAALKVSPPDVQGDAVGAARAVGAYHTKAHF